MCATLPNDQPLDRCAAYRARLASALVDPEVVLEIPTTVNPIDTGPLSLNTLQQHHPDTLPQTPGLLCRHLVGRN